MENTYLMTLRRFWTSKLGTLVGNKIKENIVYRKLFSVYLRNTNTFYDFRLSIQNISYTYGCLVLQ